MGVGNSHSLEPAGWSRATKTPHLLVRILDDHPLLDRQREQRTHAVVCLYVYDLVFRSEWMPITTERRETYLVMASEKPLDSDIAGQERADGRLLLHPIDCPPERGTWMSMRPSLIGTIGWRYSATTAQFWISRMRSCACGARWMSM